MSVLFVLLWIAGGPPAAVLSEVVRAESPRLARAGRIAFALLLGLDLLLAAVFFSIGSTDAVVHQTRVIWWQAVILGGVPLALVSGLAARRGYAGRHRLVLAAATLATAVLYLAFPLGFVPATASLNGLGRFAHDHHALDVLILLIPTLILLANELGWKTQEASGVEPVRQAAPARSRELPRPSAVVAGTVVFAALVWISGTTMYGMLLGLGVVLAGFGLYVWHRNHSEVQSVIRDLKRPESL